MQQKGQKHLEESNLICMLPVFQKLRLFDN